MTAILLVAGLALATRAPAAPPPAPDSPLAGTEWRLVEIQSMDDAIGTTRPQDASLYTLSLDADGTVQLRLDCNRATGTWSASPGATPASGSFTFGPLAVTQASCPPPSLDARLAAQAGYIRSYLVKDGRLHLSLMADGGIWVWEPLGRASLEPTPDPALETAILRAAPDYARDVTAKSNPARYVYDRVDLDGDGKDETFVYLLGPYFCGTGGCTLLLFTPARDVYSLLAEFPISRVPVVVSPARSQGWNDLWRLESGGGAPPSYVRHVFDGRRYVMRERRAGDQAPEGRRVLSGEATFARGIPVAPRP